MSRYLAERAYCQQLIDHKGIYRCKPGEKIPAKHPVLHPNGYSWQYYLRRCLYDAKFARFIGLMFWEKFISEPPFQLGACEDAGVPVATAIQHAGLLLRREVPILTFKKLPKAYGLRNSLEGPISFELPVLIVDDLASSHLTLRFAHTKALELGLKVHGTYFTVVDKLRSKSKAEDFDLRTKEMALVRPGQKLVTLFTSDDFHMSWDEYVSAYGKDPDFGAVK